MSRVRSTLVASAAAAVALSLGACTQMPHTIRPQLIPPAHRIAIRGTTRGCWVERDEVNGKPVAWLTVYGQAGVPCPSDPNAVAPCETVRVEDDTCVAYYVKTMLHFGPLSDVEPGPTPAGSRVVWTDTAFAASL